MADVLLASVEPLSHPDRVRTVAHYARSNGVADIVADLESRGGWYEQRIAATLAYVSRDTAWASRHLTDLNPSVRRLALKLARHLPDSALEDALRDAPKVVRLSLYGQLKGRPVLADELVESVRAEWGDDEARRILCWCTEPVVRRLLPSLLPAIHRARGWRSLAREHPQTLHQALATDLNESLKAGISASTWWSQYDTAFNSLKKSGATVKDTLDIVEAHNLILGISYDYLTMLFRHEPQRTFRLLRKHHQLHRLTHSATSCRLMVRSALPSVQELIEALRESGVVWVNLAFFRCFPPSKRVELLELLKEGCSTASVLTRYGSENLLPRPDLANLARKAIVEFEQAAEGTKPPYHLLAYLPPEEVRDDFLKGTRLPDPSDRSSAWRWYILNAEVAGSEALTAAAVEAAPRLRNEQQPVRATALSALASVPARLWNENALEHLRIILKDATEARDASYERHHVMRMAAAVLSAHMDSAPHVAWVEVIYDMLIKRGESTPLPELQSLRQGHGVKLWNFYRPYMAKEAVIHKYSILFEFARSQRADSFPGLWDALWKAITGKGNKSTVRSAIELWLKPKSLRRDRVADLIAFDRSCITIPVVAEIIATIRTDLLDCALGPPPNGLFKSADALPWVFYPSSHSVRLWTPAQAARLLAKYERSLSSSRGLWEKKRIIRYLKDIPGGLKLVRSLATDKRNEVDIVEASLGVLSSSPADLGLLYGLAGGDRARVAIYAAYGSASRTRPSILAPHLTDLLTRKDVKVTSKKEATRQAVSLLPLNISMPLLVNLMASEELHRDTRIACFSAVKPMLSVEAAWDILYKAVDADEPFVKQALCDVSTLDFTHELRRRYAPIVIRLAKDEHMDVKCRALQALAAWAIYSPDAGSALVNSSTNMSARESEWKAAVQSLVQWGDTESLLKATRALLDHGDESDDKGSDLPAVRRLKTLCDSLQRGPHAAASYAVATLVAEHEDFVPHAARLRAARIDYDDPGKALEDLRDLVRLLSHRPLMALRLRLEILDHCAISPAGMDTIARGLIDDGGTVAGIFAVGLIAREGGKEKWSEGRREMLLELRRHPDADVRDEARRARMQ